jgi:ketosteroid isomerase-like protein
MKKRLLLIIVVLGLFFMTRCDKKNRQADAVVEILKTDREFSEYSRENSIVKAFLAFADERSVLIRDSGLPLVGKGALEEHMKKKSTESLVMTWEPIYAEASVAGDLGYSYGTFKICLREKPEETVSNGCYVSIWKRQKNGTWKWILDAGSQGLEEQTASQKTD